MNPASNEEIWIRVEWLLREMLRHRHQPSAAELLDELVQRTEETQARWLAKPVIVQLSESQDLTRADREYLRNLLGDGSLDAALAGQQSRKAEIESTIDALLRQSAAYKSSATYREMLQFMAQFRDYAPYNNMLVKLQNPSCSFFATAKDWREKFERALIEDARPMLILAPMHPVMLDYGLDQTTGKALPEHLQDFARFNGTWDQSVLALTCRNADVRDHIRVDIKQLSSTNGGFATIAYRQPKTKMRIAIHEGLDKPSQYGVLCHELAHIYLGHLGSDSDHWWPSRKQLDSQTEEIEAESVAYLVTERAGLHGASASYISGHLRENKLPSTVSLDLIARAASRIEEMGKRNMQERPPRRNRKQAEAKREPITQEQLF
jgi:Zn-dependent peptidase ImmA (M78 family)